MRVLDFILFIIIILSLFYIGSYYYEQRVAKCISNPIAFHMEKMQETWVNPPQDCERLIEFYTGEINTCFNNRK